MDPHYRTCYLSSKMKVGIVVDVIADVGGAEKVLESLLELYPRADVFTLAASRRTRQEWPRKHCFNRLITSPFQIFVLNKIDKYFSIVKLLAWLYWETLNLNEYDLIISSSHSYGSKAVKKTKGAVHISYIHTPPRYLYDEFSEIEVLRRFPFSWLFAPTKKFLITLDRIGATRPDILIANSATVQNRIKDYYNLESLVLYPPVKMYQRRKKVARRKKYYLCMSRLVKQKGISLVVKTFSRLKKPLFIVGDGPERNQLESIAGNNTKFFGYCEEKVKVRLLSGAKALIYPSIDEDFGLVPVEALSAGRPVIAYHSGGVRETIDSPRVGLFFYKHTTRSLSRAVKRFESRRFRVADCQRRASYFSEVKFKQKFRQVVKMQFHKLIKIETFSVNGIPIVASPFKSFCRAVIKQVEERVLTVYCLTLNEMAAAQADPDFKKILNSGDYLTPDGMPLVWCLKINGKDSERIYGPDLMEEIFSISPSNLKHYFIGSDSSTLRRLKINLRLKHPNINFGEFYAPSYKSDFTNIEVAEIAEKLGLKRAQDVCVWIGLGSGKQIKFASKLKKHLSRGCVFTVGAAFSFLAHTKPQAPKIIRHIGMEWFFRLVKEPNRLGPRYFRILKFLAKSVIAR